MALSSLLASVSSTTIVIVASTNYYTKAAIGVALNPIPNNHKTKTVTKQQPIVSLISRQHYNYQKHHRTPRASSSSEAESTMTTTIEKAGVKIVNNPPESKLTELGVRSWPKWGCPPSKFPWTYSAKETCYLLKGKVKVYPEGSDEAVEIKADDLVVFPKGMSCTWDVSEEVDKHYNFE